MSPQQKHDGLSRSRASLTGDTRSIGPAESKRRVKSVSHRRQSAPSLVITKALSRSKTVSRESFPVPVSPETCPLVQSFLTCSDRSFLLHGQAQLKTGLQTQERHLFLFSDVLVIAKAKSASHFKLKAQACLCDMWMAGCMEEVCEGSTSPERSFVMGWPTCNCVATFSSADQKDSWLSLLKSRIKEEKDKDEPKTIPLRVYGKGLNTSALTKTVPVSNSDSANEVVRLALQQFGIAGTVRDYQLWVVSKRDNTPYPLIGHEFPFSIQMSHVRDRLPQAGGNMDALLLPVRQPSQQAEQLQGDKQCQFILKPRPTATAQQDVSMESSQKPFKRRRSLINWAFWRGSSPQLNVSAMSLACPAPGCLFGKPLAAVCQDDALPKQIMDMLVFLYHEGSWTRGIFRRSAGARAVRELRDSLDAGALELPLTRDHVFIIAGVFKDFLRSLPGGLLCSDLYKEWMDVLDEEEEEEEIQVQGVQRLIGRLPKENALLLHYLIAMLHGIHSNAYENQMTSFNLSVCIAPSVLWPPGLYSPEVEGVGAKKVCELVKFMIDNCHQVLGKDPTTLFNGPPQRHSSEEIGSDTWLCTLTDSSYESLENELDDSSPGSPAGLSALCINKGRRRTKHLQGSLESILTLSDYDQDNNMDTSTQVGNQHPATTLSCSSQGTPSMGTLTCRNPTSIEGPYRQRRCSEPAIAYVNEFKVFCQGSTEDLSEEDEDDEGELSRVPSCHKHHRTQSQGQNWRSYFKSELGLHGRTSRTLEASSPSLSSPPTSPAPMHSSLDSLDSLHSHSSEQTCQTRHRLCPAKVQAPLAYPSSSFCSTSSCVPPDSTRDTTREAAPGPSVDLDDKTCPKCFPPKEHLSWGSLIGCRVVHPNTWLKKDRRLSLTSQDNLETEEEEDRTEGGSINKTLANRKVDPEKGQPGEKAGRIQISMGHSRSKPSSSTAKEGVGRQARRSTVQDSLRSPPPKHNSSSSADDHFIMSLQYPNSPRLWPSDSQLTVSELRNIHTKAFLQHAKTGNHISKQEEAVGSDKYDLNQPTQAAFYRQNRPTLSLFRQNKPHSTPSEEKSKAWISQRRASEPGPLQLGEDQASAVHMEKFSRSTVRQRLPSDPGLKVSDVDLHGERNTEPRFCLSPSATKAVKDYFLSHPRSNPQSSKQVALALVESRREWLRRCSDPMTEKDFDQLLFTEESFV
ncbi:rho GTPase-activating protein 20-like [Lampris incognitus]|uniref:rho GTPase-activating protein 20-like n=1 Tax=Lampris incognitus TaxID=2546036 RepID=UPI0024B56D13|nr:rho GTPase-activating protein 20-like [Lampris incognitus]